MPMQTCSHCKKAKDWSQFSVRGATGRPRSDCKACAAARARTYRADNLELVRARNAAWMRDYYRPGHADEIRKRQRERWRRIGHAEQRARIERKKREDFIGWHVQFARRHNRSLTASDLRALWERQGGRCGLTGRPLVAGPRALHLDHILPLRRGGGSDLSNLRWVTKDANFAKRDMTDDELLHLCRDIIATLGPKHAEGPKRRWECVRVR